MSGIRRSRLAGSARHSAAQILTFAHGSGPSLTIMAGAWQNTLNDLASWSILAALSLYRMGETSSYMEPSQVFVTTAC
jgi:hypothetical protein